MDANIEGIVGKEYRAVDATRKASLTDKNLS